MRFVLAIFAVAAMLAFASHSAQAGGEGVIRAGSYSANVGEQVTVVLEVVDILPPGVGAWTIDMSYDNSIVDAIGCDSRPNSACSPIFTGHTVRVTGASETGLTGTFTLATFEFRCDVVGTSELILDDGVLATADPVMDIEIPLEDGSITCTEPGQDGVIRIGSYEAEVGEEVTAVLEAVDIPLPGLGTWTVDITYDTSVVSVVECNAQLGGVCNPAYGEDTLRVTGASAGGLSGTATLAEIVFACSRAGTTDLEVSLTFGRSFPVGEAPSFPSPISGRLTCTEPSSIPPAELPTTGVAERQPSSLPAAVPLAVLGIVLLAVAFAFRRYASPR